MKRNEVSEKAFYCITACMMYLWREKMRSCYELVHARCP